MKNALNNDLSSNEAKGPFLIISGHDFRSPRKANIHFIAEQLATRGQTRFFSLGYSLLSIIKNDPRVSLYKRSNIPETHNGIDCFLWRTVLHPVNLKMAILSSAMRLWFRKYAKRAPEILRHWIRESNTIIIESGMGIILFDLIKTINPSAKILYIASDDLTTIGCATCLNEELMRRAYEFDGIRIPSLKLVPYFPPHCQLNLIPHGIDHSIKEIDAPSPYTGGINLVSVGSMLFDREFFKIACKEMPEATFHVIGAGWKAKGLAFPNLRIYKEMPFRDTIAFIKHANAGIAPYDMRNISPYLVDSSMKLMQYAYFGIPAICPQIVTGNHAERFGYEPGNANSIAIAIRKAIDCGHIAPKNFLTWGEVTDRILNATAFPNTRVI